MTPEQIRLSIQGMHCAACSSRIERVIGNKPYTASISVSLANNTAQIVLEQNASYQESLQDIIESIKSLGFEAQTIKDKGSSPLDAVKRFDENAKRMEEDLRLKRHELTFSFLFAVPLMLLSMLPMISIELPASISPVTQPFMFALVQLTLCLPVLYAGRRFYLTGLPALWRKAPTMDTLVALGTGAAFLYSLWETVSLYLHPISLPSGHQTAGGLLEHFIPGNQTAGPELYYESAAMVIALVSLGKYLEAKSRMRTGAAIKGLLQLTPETATRLLPPRGLEAPHLTWQQEEVPLENILPHDILLIKPGGRIPVDGIVLEGASYLDESMLTGESLPVRKEPGNTVTGGTINQQGTLAVKAEKVGAETTLARIIQLVEQAQGSKAAIAGLADKVSLYFVPTVMAIAVLAGAFWLWHGEGTAFALRIFVSVMIIACPCAMGLATPMSIMVASGRGAGLGLLFKNGQALENASRVTTMVFDKTGTLTTGKPMVTDTVLIPTQPGFTLPSITADQALAIAASLEAASEHPLAEAIVRKAAQKKLTLFHADGFTAIPGKGVTALVTLEGQTIKAGIGNKPFTLEQIQATHPEAPWPGELDREIDRLSSQGKTAVVLSIHGLPVCVFAIADPLREEAAATIEALHKQNIATVMLTGDNQTTAKAIAEQAGISSVIAEVMPEQKEAEVRNLQKSGAVVGMVGDGINDAPALARADLGLAMSNGIDIAVEAGDVVLMRNGIAAAEAALELGRATLRNIKENLFWAFAYNIVGIPFAAGVFHLAGGVTLSPMLAGAAMSLSSVCVVANALRLRFFTPGR